MTNHNTHTPIVITAAGQLHSDGSSFFSQRDLSTSEITGMLVRMLETLIAKYVPWRRFARSSGNQLVCGSENTNRRGELPGKRILILSVRVLGNIVCTMDAYLAREVILITHQRLMDRKSDAQGLLAAEPGMGRLTSIEYSRSVRPCVSTIIHGNHYRSTWKQAQSVVNYFLLLERATFLRDFKVTQVWRVTQLGSPFSRIFKTLSLKRG